MDLKIFQLAPTYDEIKLAIKRGGLIYVTPAHTSLFTPVVDCLDGTCIPLRSPQTILMACLWEQDTGSPCRPMATSPMCFSPSNKIRFFTLGLPLKVPSTKKLIWARLGVSRTIYANVDSPNLGFPYFNVFGDPQCKNHPVYVQGMVNRECNIGCETQRVIYRRHCAHISYTHAFYAEPREAIIFSTILKKGLSKSMSDRRWKGAPLNFF